MISYKACIRKMSHCGLDSQGSNPDREFGISIFITKFKVVVRPVSVSLGIRQPDHEVDNSSECSADVQNVWSLAAISLICLLGMLVMPKCNLTLYYR
jgi:hypothetical protein